ncbi:MAG: branched-chain alpha-keto acid dehydrogenase subunit E2, partial [Phenylobacterium zucineum]
GAVGRRPVVDADGELGVQIACEAGLTVDHRAADGADGARALDLMQTLLQDPVLLLA